MKKTGKFILGIEIILSIFIFFSCILSIFNTGWMSGFENKWSDYLFRYYVETTADKRIFIAAIDEKTTKVLGYPLKRRYYGALIDNLGKLGVKVIGMDVMFFEPYRDDPLDDRRLIEAVKKNGNVINLFATGKGASGENEIKVPFSDELSKYSRYIGHPNVQLAMDADGHIRRYKPFRNDVVYSDAIIGGKECLDGKCNGLPMPSLAAASYAAYKNYPISSFYIESKTDLSEPQNLNFRKPVGWNEKKETDGHIYGYISVVDIIEGNLTKEEKDIIKGGIALVGSTTLGAYDHSPSPFAGLLPGVEFHATCLDNLLHNDFLKPIRMEFVILLSLILIFTPFSIRKYSTLAIFIPVIITSIALYFFSIYMFSKDIKFIFVGPLVSLWLSFIVVIVHKAFTEGREKAWIKNTFGQYLSPKIVKVITEDPSKLKLGGDKRDMTVFFLDIAHFTSIAEKLSPEELTQMLNKYLSGLTDVILKYDGVVDKYIGDCIMAFWNAPLDQDKHRTLACFAAIDCIKELDKLNREALSGDEKPAVRIGLNSGQMVVGNMGSNTRLSYTVLGDSVNLASRLEGANKFFGSKIMVSEFIYNEVKDDVEARFLGRIRVFGKELPVKVYELLARKGDLSDEAAKLLGEYNNGLDLFYKTDYKKAQTHFDKALKLDNMDGPSKFYKNISREYAENPPENWDGSFNLRSK
ncbi:MAG: adenylate/guanylate cyclase domain-containing protein [Elusimicrobia bacterium]|nr:adenylate/guanylate cyclase domain-containing protein [Elusimicrobiota bacterium]